MPNLNVSLMLDRCPHCQVARPNLSTIHNFENTDPAGRRRFWHVYQCGSCAGIVTAWALAYQKEVLGVYPAPVEVDPTGLSEKTRELLKQAVASHHAPAGAVMLAASAVDSMLKEKGYTDGSLYKRIEKAATDHLITKDMADWAHEVRLDANDQRHSDQSATLPTTQDAKRATDFALALAQFMFALPARVARGRAEASGGP